MEKRYTDYNAEIVDQWVREGWEWGQEISHEQYEQACMGNWEVLLTPTHPVPKEWFCPMQGANVLGLASGGGQQMPIFTAQGARCTVLDYSGEQLGKEALVAEREGYEISLVQADMTQPLPFADGQFDLIFHPVSNCYVRDVLPIWKECFRVLKPGGILLAGLDNGINYLFDEEDETRVRYSLPFDPLSDSQQYEDSVKNDWGFQFSHTIEEQIGGQLEAGFVLSGIYQDTNGSGELHRRNVPTFYATKAVKPLR